MSDTNYSVQNKSGLIILSIFVIVGNVFIILKSLISFLMLLNTNDDRSENTITFINTVYFIEFLSCIGSILGVILILNNLKIGLRIYQASTILYIILTFIFAVFCFFSVIGILIGLLQLIYLVVSITFLVLISIKAVKILSNSEIS